MGSNPLLLGWVSMMRMAPQRKRRLMEADGELGTEWASSLKAAEMTAVA